MSKVRYTIRLYYNHDLDLITFVETHEFNICHAIYSALSAFSKRDLFVIEIPPRRDVKVMDVRKMYTTALTLDTEHDANIIEMMSKIKSGYRNNFMKNLLRQYLCNPMSEDFLIDMADADYFYDAFSIFRAGKRVAQAGKMTTTRQAKKPDTVRVEKKAEEVKPVAVETPAVEVQKPKEKPTHVASNEVKQLTFAEIAQEQEREEEVARNDAMEEEAPSAEDADEIMDMFSALAEG